MKDARLPAWLEPHVPLCEAVAALFHPLVEVTVHDLRRGRLVTSWSGAGRGSAAALAPALAALAVDPASRGILGPVAAELPGGRAGTAVGVVLVNARGAPRGLLAITFDRSPLDDAVALLAGFAAPPVQGALAAAGPSAGWDEQIVAVVVEECRDRGFRRDRLTRAQRAVLVRALDERGLFSTRHAAAHAARALGVSRTTVYDLLKEARS